MGRSTKKELNENSTATTSQQDENVTGKEMSRKDHIKKETLWTELKTKRMQYLARLKLMPNEKRLSREDSKLMS